MLAPLRSVICAVVFAAIFVPASANRKIESTGYPAKAPVLLQVRQEVNKPTAAHGEKEIVSVYKPLPTPDVKAREKKATAIADKVGRAPRAMSDPVEEFPFTVDDESWEMFGRIVALRASGYTCPNQVFPPNFNEFKFDCRPWRAGKLHAQEMANNDYVRHISIDGRDSLDRTAAEGLAAFPELLAAGTADVMGTLDQWKSHAGACEALMEPLANVVSVAHVYNRASFYQDFWVVALTTVSGTHVDTSCYDPKPITTTTKATIITKATTITITTTTTASATALKNSITTSLPTCTDLLSECQYWASYDRCWDGGQYNRWAMTYCCRTCKGNVYGCYDLEADCAEWATQGYCQTTSRWHPYMKLQCGKSCDSCRPEITINTGH